MDVAPQIRTGMLLILSERSMHLDLRHNFSNDLILDSASGLGFVEDLAMTDMWQVQWLQASVASSRFRQFIGQVCVLRTNTEFTHGPIGAGHGRRLRFILGELPEPYLEPCNGRTQ